MADVAMPRLSDSMEEGTILKWLKSDGDEVERGEELVEIETDKANMTYEADQAGVLKIVAQEGDTLPVGETIAQIGGGRRRRAAQAEAARGARGEEEGARSRSREPDARGRAARRGRRSPRRSARRSRRAGRDGGARRAASPSDGNGRVKASPVARRMARELGVELAALEGTGPGGRIVKADVEAAARTAARPRRRRASAGGGAARRRRPSARSPQPVASGDAAAGRGETTIEELTRLQQTIARRMAESKATAPEFVLTCEVDMEEAVEFRKQLKAAAGDEPARRPSTTSSSRPPRSRCASSRAPTAPTATASSSSTRASTSASRSPARTR